MAELTAEERIAAVAKRRAERESQNESARIEQMATDLEAIDLLEAEHGHDRVFKVELVGWQPGLGAATMIAYRLPMAREAVAKRFLQQANAKNLGAQQMVDAQEAMAKVCIVYPDPTKQAELYKATTELSGILLYKIGQRIYDQLCGKVQEEGK